MPWKIRITSLVTAAALILSFQNCSDFSLQDQILYEQALLESREALDAELIPALINSSALDRWYKSTDSNYINTGAVTGDQWSFVVAVSRSATGKIIYMNSATDTEEGSLTISGGKIQAARHNAVGTSYDEIVEGVVPSSGDNMVIAASFGAKKGEVSLLINGKVQQSGVVSTGVPADFTSSARTLNTSGSFLEYVMFSGVSATNATAGKLNIAELNVMSRYLADNLAIPGVIFDPAVVGGASGGGGTVDQSRFLAAKAVFEAKCVMCHYAGGNYPNLTNLTEAKALSFSPVMVVKGDLASSKLYYRLVGSVVGPSGSRNMPQNGSLSASEVQAVADWINNIP